jgi:HK97 family phage prohead protease
VAQRYPNGFETRAFAEIRSAGRTLFGCAAPFNVAADIGGSFTETIMPGAFRDTLARRLDVVALADHRANALLGRVRSGSLRLNETATGLHFSLDLPDTSLGRDVAELAKTPGLLGGVSIGFVSDDESWPDPFTRRIKAATLHEISIVSAHPAYPDTTVSLRARSTARADHAAARLLGRVL